MKEACEILGIEKMTLTRWLRPGSGSTLPGGGYGEDKTRMITPKRIKSGPVWVKSDVERFRDEIGRERALARPKQPAEQDLPVDAVK